VPLRRNVAKGQRDQTEKGNRTAAALAACGRGTIEEDAMPVSCDRARPAQHWRRGSDPDKEDSSDEQHKRHYGVHHDA
jgi:hypothetical protein